MIHCFFGYKNIHTENMLSAFLNKGTQKGPNNGLLVNHIEAAVWNILDCRNHKQMNLQNLRYLSKW